MDKLLKFLNSLSRDDRAAFVASCGTSEGYLRKAISVKQRFGTALCIALERESRGAISCEDLIPDADWAFIRASLPPGPLRKRRATDKPTPPTN